MKQRQTCEIRRAQPTDAAGILDCLVRAFAPYRDLYTLQGYSDTVLDETNLARRMKEMRLFVAVREEVIVGTVGGSVGKHEEGHLRGMAVVPEMRGSGVAAALLSAVESELRNMGCRRVTLDTTLPLEAAMKFYEKHGYARSGRVTHFFGMPLIEYVKRL